ncbi:MAG: Type 1 glutamine amidotransferase-like domain-containing protein [Clostridia bacterium]|nr:Type 1 glutamine amidotransferase-like domain-containing protein [Clostridia bacterium]
MDKYLICIGGGEIRSKETLDIDKEIALLAKQRAGEKRAVAVFVGTASHDSLPYFNSFRKTYTSHFDIKADLALLTKKDIPMDKISGKLQNADLIYVGGGNTIFMLETWKATGFLDLLLDAYNRGVIIAGLSAGAICWFEKMYTDSVEGSKYEIEEGLGVLKGMMSPHYDNRPEFDEIAKNYPIAYAVENKSAIVFKNGSYLRTLSAGGDSYKFENDIKIKL